MFKQTARIIQRHVKLRMHRRRSCQSTFVLRNLKLPPQTRRHLFTTSFKHVKHFTNVENQFAYDILQTPPVTLFTVADETEIKPDDFDEFFDRDWRSVRASEITQAFQTTLEYCTSNNTDISDRKFDKLVDGLLDNVEHLTTSELATLLNCLSLFPQTESFKSHNYHDIWSALDDICCAKMQEWDVVTLFAFADLWYKLNLGRIGDFVYEVLEKLSKKPERLTKDQLVHAFFLMNICRKRRIEFAYEHALEMKIGEMSVDEMAIAAMGYFKTQSKIKMQPILLCMIDRVKEECETIRDISLTAILKIVRFSSPVHLTQQIFELAECLTSQVHRLSSISCLHIALLGTTTQVLHETSLSHVAQKLVGIIGDIEALRLKDIERLLLALTMFDLDPKTQPDIFEASLRELHRPERLPEKVKYPRCTCSALSYLSMRNIYSHELMNKLLDDSFINEAFGKSSKLLPRELFLLDRTIEIDCPDYKGNRLDSDRLHKAAKWLTQYAPDHNQSKRISSIDKFYLDVVSTTLKITGSKNNSLIEHVLPHYAKPDIILCRRKQTNEFVEPSGFEDYTLGDIMSPQNREEFTWYAIVVVGWNMTTRNTFKPLGMIATKERQLRKIGYEPVLVLWHEYLQLGKDEKVDYILDKM